MHKAIRRWACLGVVSLGLGLGLSSPAFAGNAKSGPPLSAYAFLPEWDWDSVAKECIGFLGPKGYAAVLVSPPQEHVADATASARHRPLSYRIRSRGGDRARFKAMVERCKAAGVDVYVEAVINHMAAPGTEFPAVPYGPGDFHPPCEPAPAVAAPDRQTVTQCRRQGQPDLDTGNPAVQSKIAAYLGDLLALGVAGFKIDSAKHIRPAELGAIKALVPGNPVFMQDIERDGSVEADLAAYAALGPVTESRYATALKNAFLRRDGLDLASLRERIGQGDWLASEAAVVAAGSSRGACVVEGAACEGLTPRDGERFHLAHVFMLAYDYGHPEIASEYHVERPDALPQPQPYAGEQAEPGNCSVPSRPGLWDCTHRDRRVANMTGFRKRAQGAPVTNWTTGSRDQIAFSRGNAGFVALNNADTVWQQTFATGLPDGVYCNLLATDTPERCAADARITVSGGQAVLSIPPLSAVAIQSAVATEPELGAPCGPVQPAVILPHPITVAALSSTSVELAWKPIRMCDPARRIVREAEHYEIHRDGSLIQPRKIGAGFIDDTLKPATGYRYSVVGVIGAAKSIHRGEIAVQTPWAECGTPRPMRTTEVGSDSIGLAWDPVYFCHPILTVVRPAHSYEIYRNGVRIGSTRTTAFRDTGLAPYTRYSYTFAAVDQSGNRGPLHPLLQVSTQPGRCDPPRPEAPVKIIVGKITPRSVTLSWPPLSYCDPASGAVVEAVRYQVYRNGQPLPQTATTSFTDFNLTPNTAYSYTVEGIDANGNRLPRTPPIIVRTPPDSCTLPAVVPQVHAFNVTATGVDLNWFRHGFCDPADGTVRTPMRFEVYRNGALVATVSTLNFSDRGLMPATRYRYHVIGIDEGGVRGTRYEAVDVQTAAGKTVTVYYRQSSAAACFHFAPQEGAWSTVPGLRMEASGIAGYARISVELGAAEWIQVAFNDCNGGWDSNFGANYRFGPGVWTYDASRTPRIVAGAPVVPRQVSVGFSVSASVNPGQTLYVVGSVAPLAHWNPDGAVPLTLSGSVWSGSVPLPPGSDVEYKYIKKDVRGAVVWESGSNRRFTVPTTDRVDRYETWK